MPLMLAKIWSFSTILRYRNENIFKQENRDVMETNHRIGRPG